MITSACAPPLDRSIAFALLAAGGAQRFGGRKLLADLDGKPLWRWAAESAKAAGFATRFLIASAGNVAVLEGEAEGWLVHANRDAHEGLASSIRAASQLAAPYQRLVIALADMPFVEPAHLRRLALGTGLAFTRYPAGREGVPAAFPNECFAALEKLRGDRGAAALDWHAGRMSLSPSSPETLFDVDTVADLERARIIAQIRSKSVPSSASYT